MLRLLSVAVFAFAMFFSTARAGTDEEEREKRIESCQTDICVRSVVYLYHELKETLRFFATSSTRLMDFEKKLIEAHINRMRGQLHDAEIFPMMEDGRWDAMTERQKHEWTEKRWGPDPYDIKK